MGGLWRCCVVEDASGVKDGYNGNYKSWYDYFWICGVELIVRFIEGWIPNKEASCSAWR